MNSKNILNLTELLQTYWVDVEFTKKNGENRTLHCTTNIKLIPEQFHPKKKDENPTEEFNEAFAVDKPIDTDKLYSVYVENAGWRSFRESQINKINEDVIIRD